MPKKYKCIREDCSNRVKVKDRHCKRCKDLYLLSDEDSMQRKLKSPKTPKGNSIY